MHSSEKFKNGQKLLKKNIYILLFESNIYIYI